MAENERDGMIYKSVSSVEYDRLAKDYYSNPITAWIDYKDKKLTKKGVKHFTDVIGSWYFDFYAVMDWMGISYCWCF